VGGEVITTPTGAPALDSTSTEKVPADAALLEVAVPAEARVFVNGNQTTSTGGLRRYLSRGLAAGRRYEFVVRIAVDRDGKTAEQTKVVSLTAGERTSVSFVDAAAASTSLTLHVPADAKVWLAGNATASSGETRHFETRTLRPGQTWRNYEIKVTTVVDGRELVVSKTINLAAGDRVDLALDPASAGAEATASLR
jgi:uncharacterized protein (TIGR03000 family)